MDLTVYLNKIVYVTLSSGYYYKGLVLSTDKNSFTMRDKVGKIVTISINEIATIMEVRRSGN